MLASHVATAIDPGSFDPRTNGHLSIIQRGLPMFDRLIV
ncbi:MAG: adenylyltransferase/cytidyltransferase family protein, partial [Myxococcaceae bacterium]